MLKPNDLHFSILKQIHLHGSMLKQKPLVPCYVSLNESVLADGPWGRPQALSQAEGLFLGRRPNSPPARPSSSVKKTRAKPELFARQSLFYLFLDRINKSNYLTRESIYKTRKESPSTRQDSLSIRQGSLSNRQDTFSTRQESVTSRRNSSASQGVRPMFGSTQNKGYVTRDEPVRR
jgi:hypothetical protein